MTVDVRQGGHGVASEAEGDRGSTHTHTRSRQGGAHDDVVSIGPRGDRRCVEGERRGSRADGRVADRDIGGVAVPEVVVGADQTHAVRRLQKETDVRACLASRERQHRRPQGGVAEVLGEVKGLPAAVERPRFCGVGDPHLLDAGRGVAGDVRRHLQRTADDRPRHSGQRRRCGKRRGVGAVRRCVRAVEKLQAQLGVRPFGVGRGTRLRAVLHAGDGEPGAAVSARATDGSVEVGGGQSLREERRRGEGRVQAVLLGRRCPRQRCHPGGICVGAGPEADAAQHAAVAGHVGELQRQCRHRRGRGHAVRAAVPVVVRAGGGAGQVEHRLAVGGQVGGDGKRRGLQAEGVSGGPCRDRCHCQRCGGRRSGHPVREVDAGHREPVEGRLQQRLPVDAGERGRAGQVVALGLDERLAHGDGRARRAGPQLVGDLRVQLGAVGEEVGVGVLVSGAGDQRGALPRHRLRPVQTERHAGHAVAVDEVVAGVAAGAEHERLLQQERVCLEVGGEDRRLVVSGQGAVRAEVSGQIDQVVAAVEQRVLEVCRRPGVGAVRRPSGRSGGRRHPLVGDERVARPARAG